ncbi:HNHc domain containing protein [uncultured Caudovirales phage]|uniref:HNHc domain containing protein n=1 Tax=uncultured Caudovirales phage TaxID=2100421 RepID=A0A6J5P3A0_9CAUD|nr:HNHc domain containing protein [uncultured Caudovirales phage]CAB4151272.1 HNHc domain containing protein [uncultured Caudovirales phage]CAB4166279.1 HNHc domain containing protein [uncultured Caudovirales phage]
MPHVDAAVRKAYHKAYDLRYRAKHPEKVKAYNARYHAANAEKAKARTARYYAENADKLKAKGARYRAENAEKANAYYARYYAEHPEKRRAKEARSRAKHPDKERARKANRRACKRSAGGRGITGHQWRDVLTSTLELCTYCNERRPLALDHIVPLSGGGEHDIENAVPACKPCNSAKGKTPLLLWLARRAA